MKEKTESDMQIEALNVAAAMMDAAEQRGVRSRAELDKVYYDSFNASPIGIIFAERERVRLERQANAHIHRAEDRAKSELRRKARGYSGAHGYPQAVGDFTIPKTCPVCATPFLDTAQQRLVSNIHDGTALGVICTSCFSALQAVRHSPETLTKLSDYASPPAST